MSCQGSKIKTTLCVLLLLLLVPVLVLAQSDRGSITGTVTDPAGAVVPAAKVVATRADTGAVYETVTTNTGNYTLPSLPVGVYSVSVEAAGFTKYIQKGITIQTVQVARVDVASEGRIGFGLRDGECRRPVAEDRECGNEPSRVSGDEINSLP